MTTALTFYVDSDLYQAGHSCDGHPYTAEAYFVMAEDATGNRWRHHATFKGCTTYSGEETDGETVFTDVRVEAEAKVDRLLARIQAAGGVIDLAHWSEARPAYGSDAYQAYGQYDDWMTERKEAGVAI